MKEYFLKINKDGSLNGAYLSMWEGDVETILIRSIKQRTKKGWESKKLIFEDLQIINRESDCDLIITEDCANMLVEKYANVQTKTYHSPHYVPVSAAHVIANFITKNGTDPYDRG
jgi:hypothetical protein